MRKNIGLLLLILCTAFLAYIPAFKSPFYLNDFIKLNSNKKIYDQGLIPALTYNFANKSQLPDRPLLIASTWINYKLTGMSPLGFKLINIFLHALTAFTLMHLILLFLRLHNNSSSLIMPLLCSLIFLLHPLNTFAINFILQRGIILTGLFGLLSLYNFLKFKNTSNEKYYCLSVLFFILALLCKPAAISFALIIGFYLLLFSSAPRLTAFKQYAPFLILLLIPLYFKYALDLHHQDSSLQWYEYLSIQTKNIFLYLKLFFIPINLHFFYNIPKDPNPLLNLTWLAILSHTLILSSLWIMRKKNAALVFCILSIYAAFIPESSIFPIKHLFFEYRSYLPLIFFILSLAFLLRNKQKAVTYMILSLIITIFTVLTLLRNYELRSTRSWYIIEVNRNPTNHDLNYTALSLLITPQDNKEAIKFLQRLILLFPEHREYFILNDILHHSDIAPYLLTDDTFKSISNTQLTNYYYLLTKALTQHPSKYLAWPIKEHYFYSKISELQHATIIKQYKNMLKSFKPTLLKGLNIDQQNKLLDEINKMCQLLLIDSPIKLK